MRISMRKEGVAMRDIAGGRNASPRWVVLIAALSLSSLALAGSVSAGPARTVQIGGDEQFVPNAMIMATLRFSPGPITVESGDTVTWVNNTDEPHTITVVDAADVPTSIFEVFACGAPGGPCFSALAGHGTNPPTLVLGGGADGVAGLDGVGDSLLVFPDGTVSAPVTAAAGTTLHYLCAIHAWMIGTIDVR
jgi:plastocyanin